MKKLLLSLALLASVALTGCATGAQKAFSDAHESASKRGIAESQASAKVKETEALAAASAVKACESDVCRVAVMGFANMRQMVDKHNESKAPDIAAPVDPILRVAEKVIDGAVTVVLGKYGLDGKLSDNSKGAGDSALAAQINRSNTIETRSSINANSTTTTAK